MSYCLLIKCVDGSLNLLSETPFDTRNEALDTLASYADSGRVDCATDQVWLIDLASVAPVVLVGRPAMGGRPVLQPEPEAEVAPEPEAIDEVSPEPEPEVEVAEEPQLDVVDEPDLTVEPEIAVEPEPSVEVPSIAADLPEPGAVFEPDAAFAPVPVPEPMILPVLSEDAILPIEEAVEFAPDADAEFAPDIEAEVEVEETAADVVVEDEAAAVFEVETVDETPVAPVLAAAEDMPAVAVEESILDDLVIPEPDLEPSATEEDSFSDLREALERSAAQMASEVSEAQAAAVALAAETPAVHAVFTGDAAAEVTEDEDAAEPVSEVATEYIDDFEIDVAVVEEPTPEVAAVEDIECGDVIDADTALDSEVGETAEPAEWPWAAKLPEVEADSEPEAIAVVVPEADVPAEDAVELPEAGVLGSAAVSSADAIPVPVEPMSVTSGDETGMVFDGTGEDYTNLMQPAPFAAPEAPVETSIEPVEAVESAQSFEPAVVEDEPFVEAPVDSSPVYEPDPTPATDPHELMVPAGVGAPGYTPDSGGVADLTCQDCVWVDTCPNKDQRDPASCGSFQWK